MVLALGLLVCGCGAKKQKEQPEETSKEPVVETTQKNAEENGEEGFSLDGEILIGRSGSYVGFRSVENKDWTSPAFALDHDWVVQGGDRIDYGFEKVRAFYNNSKAGIPGMLRIQRHFFGAEDREESVYLLDVVFDGGKYYYACLCEDGLIWDEKSYEAFQILEVRETGQDLLITYFVLNDGSKVTFDDNGEPMSEGEYVWVTADYVYPAGSYATIYVNQKNYLDMDGRYVGFDEAADTDMTLFYERAHAKKPSRLRLEEDGVKTDVIFDGNKYYLFFEGSDMPRVFLHSLLLESPAGTYLTLSSSDGLAWDLYAEDVSNYTVYLAGKLPK